MRNGNARRERRWYPSTVTLNDTGNEREAIITVWKRFAIQIDGVYLGTRNGEQFIRVIASERTKRMMRSNQAQ
jgi:hypothetical protein